jgi:hypothetical protein
MEERITFTGDQGNFVIEVSAYENPSATHEDDANWLASRLTVSAEPFSGSFKAAFTTHDLASLHEQLKKALVSLSGTVTFQSTEDDLSLTIEFNKRGAASITGVAQPHGSRGAALHFRFDTEQSALTRTLHELEVVLRRFPVKQMQ